MHDSKIPEWHLIHTIVFDFDGVFTDNKVWVHQDGSESVRCDRGDGLAFDMLRKFVKTNSWKLNYFILSTEKNKVVSLRANKLLIPCHQGVNDKASHLCEYLKKNNKDRQGLVYVGNDLNDLRAIQIAGFSIAPIDAHPLVKDSVNLVLSTKGGEGFVREIVEKIIGIDEMTSPDSLRQISI